ncbi:MAG: helix-turn-helix domain-containing protein, partial [Phycisphaerales bacterium]
MASMFFSLKETAQKLGKSEDEVRQLVKDGRLREFRDGANLLFKIDEVNALVDEGIDMGLEAVDLSEAPAEEQAVEAAEGEAAPMADEDLFMLGDEETPTLEPTGEVEATSELGLAPEETAADETGTSEEELLFLADEGQPAADGTADATAEGTADATGAGTEDEISLAAESGVLAAGSDITDADTALTAEGVNVLGESSTDFTATEDSMAETAVGPAGSTGEASLEEIEDDVSLDSFGSGSGLLDLSLQADDTSLGGILDEIYTSEGGEAAGGEAE